jgi:hypothetical protein
LIVVVTAVGAAARGTDESAAIGCGETGIGGVGGVVEVRDLVGRWAALLPSRSIPFAITPIWRGDTEAIETPAVSPSLAPAGA